VAQGVGPELKPQYSKKQKKKEKRKTTKDCFRAQEHLTGGRQSKLQQNQEGITWWPPMKEKISEIWNT
jgi:hypothetical protein